MTSFTVSFPVQYLGSHSKIDVIRAIRFLTNISLKEAKDLSESCSQNTLKHNFLVNNISNSYSSQDAFIEEQYRILRNNGCKVDGSAVIIIEELRNLGARALLQGEDELANEILQLVLAEKLRRK